FRYLSASPFEKRLYRLSGLSRGLLVRKRERPLRRADSHKRETNGASILPLLPIRRKNHESCRSLRTSGHGPGGLYQVLLRRFRLEVPEMGWADGVLDDHDRGRRAGNQRRPDASS